MVDRNGGSCFGFLQRRQQSPDDLEIERLTALLTEERNAKLQADKTVAQLTADIASCTEKSQADGLRGSRLCIELEEQLLESERRAEELLEEERRFRAGAEAELRQQCQRARGECQAQFDALEQRLVQQLSQEKARVLELRNTQKDSKALEARIAALEAANAQLQADLSVAQQREQEAIAALQPLEETFAALSAQRDNLTREIAEVGALLEAGPALEARNAELEARLCELEGQVQDIAKLTEEVAVQREACSLTEGTIQRLQAEEQAASRETATVESEAVGLCLELEAAERQAATFEVSEETLQTRLFGAEERVTTLAGQLEAAHAQIARLTRHVAEQREATARVSLLAATSKEVRATQSAIQHQEEQLKHLRSELDARKERQAEQAEAQTREAEHPAQRPSPRRAAAPSAAAGAKAAAPKAERPAAPAEPGKARGAALARAPPQSSSPDGKGGVFDRLSQPANRSPRGERARKAGSVSGRGINA